MGLDCIVQANKAIGFLGNWGRYEERYQTLWDLIPPQYKQSTVYSDFYAAYDSLLSKGNANFKCVGKDSGLTNHVERCNGALRQRIGRFVRRTLSFSKWRLFNKVCQARII